MLIFLCEPPKEVAMLPTGARVFSPEAERRLEAINPGQGTARYARLEAFAQAAARRPGVRLLVPPDVDEDMHQVLSARIGGKGLELREVGHVLLDNHAIVAADDPDHEDTIGRSLGELTSQLAEQTRAALLEDGFAIDSNARYTQRACWCSFAVAA